MSKYSKIIIYDQPFNDFSGGGITLTNLFRGWPKENVAVISNPFMLQNTSCDICDNYYQIGREEYHWKFPFSLYKQTYHSGLIGCAESKPTSASKERNGIKQLVSTKLLNPFIEWLGLSHFISYISISTNLKEWLSEFEPDILYIQGSNREGILFAHSLIEYLRIPSVIHMMDDWPSTISTRGPFKKYWNNRIDKEFKQLLNKVDLHLSISDAMSEEYFRRYKKRFLPFHNPVEVVKFDIFEKKTEKAECFSILYIGRIGTENANSILLFAKVISQLKIGQLRVVLDIFTKEIESLVLEPICNFDNIRVKPPVAHELVPALLNEYDLLLLPLDFTKLGLKFAKLSIPTKASEYMLSGTPVLVFAPAETAVSKFFSQNECGYCVTEPGIEKIEAAIRFLIFNKDYRTKISRNAVELAKNRFDEGIVRHEFQNILIAPAKKLTNIRKN